jgi:hypothetical protein
MDAQYGALLMLYQKINMKMTYEGKIVTTSSKCTYHHSCPAILY